MAATTHGNISSQSSAEFANNDLLSRDLTWRTMRSARPFVHGEMVRVCIL